MDDNSQWSWALSGQNKMSQLSLLNAKFFALPKDQNELYLKNLSMKQFRSKIIIYGTFKVTGWKYVTDNLYFHDIFEFFF